MDTTSTSNTKSATSSSKPKIDPLQLLKCLSILLNSKGGIRGDAEVPRVKGLMAKYSKKLVSKCIYLNILQATDMELLDAFYDEGGWELVGTWLQEAVKSSNWPLAKQVLSLLSTSPMTVSRLKRYTTPKLVKELSKDCTSPEVQGVAKHIVLNWMEVVKQGDGTGTAAGVGLTSVGQNDDSSPMDVDSLENNNDDGEAARNSDGAKVHVGSAEAPINIDSSQECGDGSSSMEGQDDSSNASTESDSTPAPTTPIRITIRSGSQVLAKVSSQRVSQDSNDSDDNKPLSVIKKEVLKARKTTPKPSTTVASTVSEETHIPPLANSPSPGSSSSATINNTSEVSASDAVIANNSSSRSADSTSPNSLTENMNVNTTISSAVSAVNTAVTSNQTAPTAPSSSNQVAESPMEIDGEADKSNVKNSGKTMITGSVNHDKEPSESGDSSKLGSESGDSKVDSESGDATVDSENKNDEVDSRNERDLKSIKDKSKEKDKDKESEKKDKKHKEREKDRKIRDERRERESSKSSKSSNRSRHSSSSKSEKDRKSKDQESSRRDKHRSSSNHSYSKSSKDKDRDKERSKSSSSRDKDKGSSKDKGRDKTKEDKHDEKKKEEQENEVKATLEKVKPLSADGLAKIPKRSTPSSFLAALGAADEFPDSKKPSVKTYKSRGFRNTGLLEEPTKPPGKKASGNGTAEKKTTLGSGTQGLKRPSPLDEVVATLPDKRMKSSVSSSPVTSDKPGGIKLISPKRHSLSDDGGFMAALTAAGPDTRKKVTRKRRSSDSDPKDGKAEDKKDEDKKEDDKSPSSSPVKSEDKGMLSPTSVKPTFNFYQETLKDKEEEEEVEKEEEENENEEKPKETEVKEEKENAEDGDEEMKEEGGSTPPNDNDDDNMDLEESIRDEDIPIAPAVPAPAQEVYEKVEVTFSEPNPVGVRSVLVYHRPENRKKKSVKWKSEDDLKEVFYFLMDETERVNVNTIKFTEMMVIDKQRERENMGKNRGFHGNMMGMNMMGMGMLSGEENVVEYMRWSLLPIMIPSPSTVSPGYKSQERITQAARESSTMAAFYHPAMLPDTPREPDPEMVNRAEPKEIPLNDVTGQDTVYDHRNKLWPDPIFTEPMNYGYGAMAGPPSGGNEGGSHWVVGGPPTGAFPGPGGPMYGGPPGGFGGPGMGGPGMGGPGNYGGDMGGPGMDPQGWGGPGPGPGPPPPPPPGPGLDYPNPNMMMGGNNQGMMMGGGGGGRPPPGPRGMMPNMGMGGQNFRGRSGPGGNWGPGPSNYGKPPVCKHFMNGHCRHGKNCRFLHNRH